MLSWLLFLALLAACVVLGTWLWGTIFGRGEVQGPLDAPREVLAGNRRALEEGRIDAIAFDVAGRGYRQDQVDDLLEALKERAAK